MDAQQLLIPLAVAFGTAVFMTPLVMRLALGIGIIDQPNERSVNQRPDVPLMGGIAVVLGFAAGLAVAVHQTDFEVPGNSLMGLAIGGALVLAAGIYDDRFGMRAWSKFSVQIVAALVAVSFGFEIDHLTEPFSGTNFPLPRWAIWPATTLWIVMVTNAINLVDGLDGLATGVSAIIGATLALIAGYAGHMFGVMVGIALVGALLGFLPFNFAPARIFLGDTGALFIGYTLSLLALDGYRIQISLLALVVPVLALAVPILDTGLSVLRRLRSHTPIFSADRHHIHHRMLETEGSARRAVLQFYLLTAAFCLIALAFSRLQYYPARILLLAAVVVLTLRLVSNLGALSNEPRAQSSEPLAAGEDPSGVQEGER